MYRYHGIIVINKPAQEQQRPFILRKKDGSTKNSATTDLYDPQNEEVALLQTTTLKEDKNTCSNPDKERKAPLKKH